MKPPGVLTPQAGLTLRIKRDPEEVTRAIEALVCCLNRSIDCPRLRAARAGRRTAGELRVRGSAFDVPGDGPRPVRVGTPDSPGGSTSSDPKLCRDLWIACRTFSLSLRRRQEGQKLHVHSFRDRTAEDSIGFAAAFALADRGLALALLFLVLLPLVMGRLLIAKLLWPTTSNGGATGISGCFL